MANKNCIFCQIVSGQMEARKLINNKDLIVIEDIAPKAPVHYLIIPKVHSNRLHTTNGHFFSLLPETIKELIKMDSRIGDYKIVINNGPDAGQEVDHLHVHILAGKNFGPDA